MMNRRLVNIMDEQNSIDAKIAEMAAVAKDWTDEEFAGRVVGLLILDEGHLNKYQRTIETALKIFRAAEALRK